MLKQMHADCTKTYQTQAVAIRSFEKVCAKLGITEMIYTMSVTPAGRFFIIVHPRDTQVQDAIALAYSGISSIRT